MRNHLGVGVGAKRDPGRRELVTEQPVIFDDAVLHHRHATRAIAVGMGVVLLRLAMGGPAGVADAAERAPS